MKRHHPFTAFIILLIFICTSCSKKPTCSDGIQNQGETRADCGGPCSPCGTCSDGVQNQDETNVDCGGVCSKCQTCSDGIQNQGETGIDCGGPCGKCPIFYPLTAGYGINILRAGNYDTTFLPNQYSIAANLPLNTSLRIKMTNLKGSNMPWGIAQGVGNWLKDIIPPFYNVQYFFVTGQINADMPIYFTTPVGNSGTAKLEFFENGDTVVSRTKIISWK